MIYSHLFNVYPHLWWKEINMDPNQNKKNDKNNRGRMRGVASLILWALVLVVVFQYINAYTGNAANKTTSHEIKYSEMVTMIEKDQVKEVLFKDSTIYVTPVEGYVYTEEVTSGGKTEEKSYKQTEDGSPLSTIIQVLGQASWISAICSSVRPQRLTHSLSRKLSSLSCV